jgi:hypothetical protein
VPHEIQNLGTALELAWILHNPYQTYQDYTDMWAARGFLPVEKELRPEPVVETKTRRISLAEREDL